MEQIRQPQPPLIKYRNGEWPTTQIFNIPKQHQKTMVQYRLIPETNMLITLHFYHKQVKGGVMPYMRKAKPTTFGYLRNTTSKGNRGYQNVMSVYLHVYRVDPKFLRELLCMNYPKQSQYYTKGHHFTVKKWDKNYTEVIRKRKMRGPLLKKLKAIYPQSNNILRMRTFFDNENLHFDGDGFLIIAKYGERASALIKESFLGNYGSKRLNLFTGELSNFKIDQYESNVLRLIIGAHSLVKKIEECGSDKGQSEKGDCSYKNEALCFPIHLDSPIDPSESIEPPLVSEINKK